MLKLFPVPTLTQEKEKEHSDNFRFDGCDLREVFGECSEESPQSFSLWEIKDGGLCGQDEF